VIGATMKFHKCPTWATNSVVTLLLALLAFSGRYGVAEKVGLAFGACQILLFITMFMATPVGSEVGQGFSEFPLHHFFGDRSKEFETLIMSNIGAVIMPWMLAYQQSAICDKGLIEDPVEHLYIERADTFIGSLLTQGVMAAMLVTVGAVRKELGVRSVETVDDLLGMFTHILGSEVVAKWFLTFSIVGACMVAAIVQTLCASYAFQEAMAPRSKPTQRNDEGVSFSSSTSLLTSSPGNHCSTSSTLVSASAP
jgi:Mn2+/Fe2+ NRAMP family transporter